MRIGLSTVLYNEHRILPAFLKQIPDWVGKRLFLVSDNPWNGKKADTAELTWETLAKMQHPNIYKYRLNWRSEAMQRNWGLGWFAKDGYDWVLILDPDEFLTKETWETLRQKLEKSDRPALAADRVITYWKTMDYVWTPEDTHDPVIAVRPDKVTFSEKRSLDTVEYGVEKLTMHHLSWVKTDEEVRQKIANYSHHKDFDQDRWFKEVWQGWDKDMGNLRPYGSEGDTRAIYQPLPGELKTLFY